MWWNTIRTDIIKAVLRRMIRFSAHLFDLAFVSSTKISLAIQELIRFLESLQSPFS